MTTKPQYRAVTERRSLDNIGLDATLVGLNFSGVLLWDVAAFVNGGTVAGTAPAGTIPPVVWAIETNSPNPVPGEGTSIKITRRGNWLATFSANVPASGGAAFGISYTTDNPLAPSTPGLTSATTPANTATGFRQAVSAVAPAATAIPVTLAAMIAVSDRDAGDAQSGIIRFHGNNDAGGNIESTDVTIATVRYTIAYVGDLMGS